MSASDLLAPLQPEYLLSCQGLLVVFPVLSSVAIWLSHCISLHAIIGPTTETKDLNIEYTVASCNS